MCMAVTARSSLLCLYDAPGGSSQLPSTLTLRLSLLSPSVHSQVEEPIVIKPNFKDGIYIGNCKKAVIIIEGKCKNLTINNCEEVGVVVDVCVTTVEIIGCKRCQIQAKESAGTFTIDKSDRCKIFLPEGSLKENKVLVYSSQSSSTNIYQPTADGEDMEEYAVPEQILSTFQHAVKPETKVVLPTDE